MALTLLVGGARSGKSSLAVEWGRRTGRPVTYIATAPPQDPRADGDRRGDQDADMAERIARHREERPATWTTIEEGVDLVAALDRAESVDAAAVVVDCLTLWTSNLMWHGRSDEAIERAAIDAATRAAEYGRPVLSITNEVGLGVHPATELGRRYRDVLGRVNQHWAARADRTLLLVAGRALALGDPWDLLPDPTGDTPR